MTLHVANEMDEVEVVAHQPVGEASQGPFWILAGLSGCRDRDQAVLCNASHRLTALRTPAGSGATIAGELLP